MEKAVIYVRVSTEEQAKHGFSIAAQQKNDIDFANKNGYQIADIYIDEGRSAKDMNRPQLQNMLNDLKKSGSNIDAVIVWKLDRITRNNEDYHSTIKPLFTKLGIKLLSATESNDYDNPMGDFFRNLGISQAELERYMTSSRTKAGMKEKAEQGYYPSKPPIGYVNVTQHGKKIIIPDPDKAHYIKKAFDLYLVGNSFKTIEQILKSEGLTCNRKTIENVFTRYAIFYTGQFDWNGKRYKGQHEGIISNKVYHAAMSIKDGKGHKRGMKRDYLYRGLIKCEICGRNLTAETQRGGHKSGEYIYYHCTDNCINKKRNLNSKYIDEAIEVALKQITKSDKETAELKLEMKEVLRRQQSYDEKAKKQIEHKISLLEKRLNKLYEDKIDGEVDHDFYTEKKELWQNELDELMFKFGGAIKANREIMEKFAIYIEPAKNAYWLYSQLSLEKKTEYLKIITSNLFYDGSKIVVELKRAYSQLSKLALFDNGADDGDRTHVYRNHNPRP